jgi:hypothetical protein
LTPKIIFQVDDDELDSDDDDDLAERLEGVDLDDADEVWKKLTPAEREEFEKMCSTGQIQDFVPKFVPWWDLDEEKPALVQEIEDPKPEVVDGAEKSTKSDARPTFDLSTIASLKSLIGDKAASPLIKFSLPNVIYAYVYAIKFFGGYDPENCVDFVSLCLEISANLRDGQNFDSADVAVESAASAANQVRRTFLRFPDL